MFTGLHHLHFFSVVLFVLLYLVKTLLLLLNKTAAYEKARKITKVPEMIISTLFLVTGIWMLIALPSSQITTLLIVKIVVVFASIPVALIGFKKSNKGLALLAFVMVLAAYGLAEMAHKRPAIAAVSGEFANPAARGEKIFQTNCVACHGTNLEGGIAGAKNLKSSTKTKEEIIAILNNGKNLMPSYKKQLADDEKTALAEYLLSVR